MVKALFFDINGTVTNIWTIEDNIELFRVVANFLNYQGVLVTPEQVQNFYLEQNKQQRLLSQEIYPEFDVVKIFSNLIEEYKTNYTLGMSSEKQKILPQVTAEVFRAASRFRLELYDGVKEVLEKLQSKYQLAAVSDGQFAWTVPEVFQLGLNVFFDSIVISSSYGYRKPDPRMFQQLLQKMNLQPEDVYFVGNDMYRDVWGAKQIGMKTIFFKSNQGGQKIKDGVEPDYIIYEFSQLLEAITFLTNQEKQVKEDKNNC